jgi:superfamily II DNA or RNA helicase
MTEILWDSGTIVVKGADPDILPDVCVWDDRCDGHRAPAVAYDQVVLALHRRKIPYEDKARAYPTLDEGLRVHREPRPYQSEALAAWEQNRGRGLVVLPTGSGKSWLAMMAIDRKRRGALVVAPTLDLVRQWYDQLRAAFPCKVGVVGGGSHDVGPITVTTYDSAYIHMEHLGRRFGLVIFDEVHHLPGESLSLAGRFCLAPFRLGLTATPERSDGRETVLDELVGPLVYRRRITELTGEFLAEYDTEQVEIDLSREEWDAYQRARQTYRDFVDRNGIRVGSKGGWATFIQRSAMSDEGRRAFEAWQEQRRISFGAPSKLDYLGHLLHEHRSDRAIVFTSVNETAYAISRRFLIPVITHQTPVKERSSVLAGLSDGTFSAVVTSRVLNEGVDVPSANVAIIVSGSGSVREHVQRLGRVLRKKPDGERAILYELIAAGTSEAYTSERRREHLAYGAEEAAEEPAAEETEAAKC